jgi:hypothetical protein
MTKKTEPDNRTEEVAQAILDRLEEFAVIYDLDWGDVVTKPLMMHVVASLFNDGVIEK